MMRAGQVEQCKVSMCVRWLVNNNARYCWLVGLVGGVSKVKVGEGRLK
jgi:hypothetical protein